MATKGTKKAQPKEFWNAVKRVAPTTPTGPRQSWSVPISALGEITGSSNATILRQVNKGAPSWFPWSDVQVDPDRTTLWFTLTDSSTNVATLPQLREMTIHDLRGIATLQLQSHTHSHTGGQWIVLLGENGVGKTTILRALALALIPEKLAITLHARASGDTPFVRHGAKQASAEVVFETAKASFSITGNKSEALRKAMYGFESDLSVFGYGSARGNALGGPDRAASVDALGGLATLFDASAALLHAETWLVKLASVANDGTKEDKGRFEAVKRTLEALLPRGDELIVVESGHAWVKVGKDKVPVGGLSDGYLTTLGWVIDLIARWSEQQYRKSKISTESFAHEMQCIVLIDELDLHFHPNWQAEIVTKLRSTFPNTTFIATTHNPLSLHGTRSGEVYVLTRQDNGTVDVLQKDLPKGIRADQVLTGEWFGLPTTVDADTKQMLAQHRTLLLQKRDENDPERLQIEEELRSRLGRFAETSVEKLAQGIAAEVLDDEAPVTDSDRERIKRVVAQRLLAARNA